MSELTSPKGLEMLLFLPRYYESSKVMREILQSQGLEHDKLFQALDETLSQYYVKTATWALDTWEKELGLSNYAGKPDEQRRSRIISKIRGRGTTTLVLIENTVKSYVEEDAYVVNKPELYTFIIKFVGPNGLPENIDDLISIIEEIKPAHLVSDYQLFLRGFVKFGVSTVAGEEATIYPWTTHEIEGSCSIRFAIGYQVVDTTTIYPM